MVEIRNLHAGYDEKNVLKGLSLSFPKGQVTVILGPNGCGKSTLLKSLVGLTPRVSGEIRMDGLLHTGLSRGEVARKIAYLPQNKTAGDMTVEQLVLHGRFPYLRYPRRYRPEDRQAAKQAMAQLGLEHLAGEPLNRLSGGTRQKCFIAMALAQDAPTILMDEPLSFLDISHQLKLLALCRQLAAEGKAVVLVLHDLALALEYAHRVVLMEAGTVRQVGTPEEILSTGNLEQVFGVKVSTHRWENRLHITFDSL